MDLDPTVIIPAILFTVVAIYLASSLLSKKPNASASSAANKKPKVGYGDDIPPSRDLTEQPEGFPQPEPPAPFVEDVGAAESIQDVPVLQVKAVPVSSSEPAPEQVKLSEPAPEQVKVSEAVPEPVKAPKPVLEPVKTPEPVPQPVKVPETLPEPVETELVPDPDTAQEVAAIPEPTQEPVSVPEPVPKPAANQEPESALEPVPELVPKSIPKPEQLVKSEPGSEAVPQPLDGTEKLNEESLPELITDSTEDDLLTPEPIVEASPFPDVEPDQDTILNNDDDKVMFASGKKQSKFETLMTKDEIEEEQRIELTSDFTSL
ncbi:FILIA-N KH-like domain-containing protein isoform X2 [Channa argus]|uniref:FILIA-N KH-like domain-containing protein isoform X2 n=1 Tax=Channa argus TaxID=215402 RepID=UPI003522FA34